ncbi:helicase associated domain-containing protein [Arthrobacter sp. NPDC093125]|uniref:helicase associated domain-containing protein n=1 Tax=Arthrobacter sp. NPDC093125 TaxID=3363944 RepID=UPI0037F17A5C
MDLVASTRRGTAPNQEWVLMYRRGLSRTKIAELVGVPAPTVGYHLRVACAADPELQSAHEAAANAKPSRVTAQGLARMQELVAMVRKTGRYPSRKAESTMERSLAVWLQRRREDARAGTLAPAYRDGLAVLPGWQTPPRAEAFEARWQHRLAALIAYRGAGNDWPRHKADISGEEHELGVWLHLQRSKLRRGELDDAKRQTLDESLPGWRIGRQRGRRP